MPPRPPKSLRPSRPIAQKVAVRFAKAGAARWHAHHDLMRFWERAVRRAELPMRLTEGFNPRPRMIFPHALGVGVASEDEWVELELVGARAPQWIAERLDVALRPTLIPLAVEERPNERKSRVVLACLYRIEGLPATASELEDRVRAMKALREYVVARGPEKARVSTNVRPYLRDASVPGDGVVRVTLMHTAQGAGRIDEWAAWLGASLAMDGRSFSLTKERTVFAG